MNRAEKLEDFFCNQRGGLYGPYENFSFNQYVFEKLQLSRSAGTYFSNLKVPKAPALMKIFLPLGSSCAKSLYTVHTHQHRFLAGFQEGVFRLHTHRNIPDEGISMCSLSTIFVVFQCCVLTDLDSAPFCSNHSGEVRLYLVPETFRVPER